MRVWYGGFTLACSDGVGSAAAIAMKVRIVGFMITTSLVESDAQNREAVHLRKMQVLITLLNISKRHLGSTARPLPAEAMHADLLSRLLSSRHSPK